MMMVHDVRDSGSAHRQHPSGGLVCHSRSSLCSLREAIDVVAMARGREAGKKRREARATEERRRARERERERKRAFNAPRKPRQRRSGSAQNSGTKREKKKKKLSIWNPFAASTLVNAPSDQYNNALSTCILLLRLS